MRLLFLAAYATMRLDAIAFRPIAFQFWLEVKQMEIPKAAYAFVLHGEPVRCREFGHGHINLTCHLTTDTGAEYVLQRINRYVFHDPVRLMENAGAVADFIGARVSDARQALHFCTTVDGRRCYRDADGEYWRMYDFVGGFCLDAPETDADFYQSALAFGNFQRMLAAFPAHTLYETIPDFHNTVDRYRRFEEAVQADRMGRLAEVARETEMLLRRKTYGCRLEQMRRSGALPLRVTHNDTKLNNVLFDRVTRESLCVLDLDTVMPGLSAYDFGDSIRFGAATAAEDEPDTRKMKLDLHRYAVYTRGFLASAELTDAEVQALPLGAYTMTLEVAMRFLTDYLDGDRYFKIDYPAHNLVRARSQLALLADMEQKWENMNRLTAEAAAV